MNRGIVYFIQPAELVGTNRYKVGCSNSTDLKRIKNGYKKGTRTILIYECNEPFVLEKKIKDVFNKKFNLIAGREYYEGNENLMISEFTKCKLNIKDIKDIKDKKVKNIYTCIFCKVETTHLNDFNKHLSTQKHLNNLEDSFHCVKCEYVTKNEVNYKRHLSTKKHIKLHPAPVNNIEETIIKVRDEINNVKKYMNDEWVDTKNILNMLINKVELLENNK